MPRKKKYGDLKIKEPFRLHSDALVYLDQFASESTQRLILRSLVRLFESMPKQAIDAEIIALIQTLAERVQKESFIEGANNGIETSI